MFTWKRLSSIGVLRDLMVPSQAATMSPEYACRSCRIVLLGNDGIERPFLCKPKDDLRKDAPYDVGHCNDKSFVIQVSRKPLKEALYSHLCNNPSDRGLWQKTNPQVKRTYDQCKGKMLEDVMLKTKILPMFPPVFHKWFLTTFSELAAWFRARIAFAHTTAVRSIVGLGE
ncbi:hypothetical protein LWI29_010821 [Acer saccharum]|uniref:PI3K/PI4K catalytic domain-containing protein n=1 Tax=Acer saccharum TaxID=4024 RepID=A0AA39RRM1_ACESA|nr:hypothetical protein LWI29_010821 [Acer saccharum]